MHEGPISCLAAVRGHLESRSFGPEAFSHPFLGSGTGPHGTVPVLTLPNPVSQRSLGWTGGCPAWLQCRPTRETASSGLGGAQEICVIRASWVCSCLGTSDIYSSRPPPVQMQWLCSRALGDLGQVTQPLWLQFLSLWIIIVPTIDTVVKRFRGDRLGEAWSTMSVT